MRATSQPKSLGHRLETAGQIAGLVEHVDQDGSRSAGRRGRADRPRAGRAGIRARWDRAPASGRCRANPRSIRFPARRPGWRCASTRNRGRRRNHCRPRPRPPRSRATSPPPRSGPPRRVPRAGARSILPGPPRPRLRPALRPPGFAGFGRSRRFRRFAGLGRILVALQERVLLELGVDIGGQFDVRQLQQLDRLLQLRRHDQRLGLPEI